MIWTKEDTNKGGNEEQVRTNVEDQKMPSFEDVSVGAHIYMFLVVVFLD